jgi:hypothetical protein
MKTAISIAVLLGLGILPSSGVAQTAPAWISATSLLEVEARAFRTTTLEIPFCDVFCRNLDPHFISYRAAIAVGGTVAGTLTEKRLEDASARAMTRIFTGTATPQQMATLRDLLANARIGFEQGGCTVVFTEEVPNQPNPTFHVYELAYTVVWYGRGNRINLFELPLGAPPCPAPLRNLMTHVISVVRDAERRARP